MAAHFGQRIAILTAFQDRDGEGTTGACSEHATSTGMATGNRLLLFVCSPDMNLWLQAHETWSNVQQTAMLQLLRQSQLQ